MVSPAPAPHHTRTMPFPLLIHGHVLVKEDGERHQVGPDQGGGVAVHLPKHLRQVGEGMVPR